MKKEKKKSKLKIILIAVAVIVILSVIFGEDEEDKSNSKTTSKPTVEATTEAQKNDDIEVTDFATTPNFTAEPNSSAMVDQIAITAKNHADDMTDEQANAIIANIRKSNPAFFASRDDMEKYMWYGYLLDYKYDDNDPRSELGTDLCQAIKYVYRGAEDLTDDSVSANLDQISDDLDAIE